MKAHTSGRVDFENNDRVGVRVCFCALACVHVCVRAGLRVCSSGVLLMQVTH